METHALSEADNCSHKGRVGSRNFRSAQCQLQTESVYAHDQLEGSLMILKSIQAVIGGNTY